MSKKETEKMLQITMEFLEGLTNKQFQDLVDKKAFIRFEAKAYCAAEYDQIMDRIKQDSDVEKLLKNYTKKELALFCGYHKVNIRSNDTKKEIYKKVASHLNINHWPAKKTAESNWKQIENALNNCGTLEEARNFLANQSLLRLKKDITAFAKAQGVYVNQKYTKQELLDRIADSVVGARIRGEIIRSAD
ncbi:hypothetical protein [Virgibacillus sp. JSM 102003]|uniref:hypothetical protein n=1 Tax=Virgibacillus sp. JSM 102003 TaxID=1562108 RepID=UPI0035BFACFB